MNFLDSALQNRGKDSKTDTAPPSKSMPGEGMDKGGESHGHELDMVLMALKSNPALLSKVHDMIVNGPKEGSPDEEASESPGEAASEGDDASGADDLASMDGDVANSLSDHDKMDLQSRKPRSLADRAKMAALSRLSGKK